MQAGSCYDDAGIPGALWQQRAVLAHLLGREAEARQLLQQFELDIAVVLSGIGNAGAAGGFVLAQWVRRIL